MVAVKCDRIVTNGGGYYKTKHIDRMHEITFIRPFFCGNHNEGRNAE